MFLKSFYTGINPIKKADGGRIGYKLGKGDIVIQEGIPALLDLVKNKFGKKCNYNCRQNSNTPKNIR